MRIRWNSIVVLAAILTALVLVQVIGAVQAPAGQQGGAAVGAQGAGAGAPAAGQRGGRGGGQNEPTNGKRSRDVHLKATRPKKSVLTGLDETKS